MYYQNDNPIIKTYQECYEDPLFFACSWSLTRRCDYKCTYCDTWREQEYTGRDQVQKVINFCNYLSSKYNLKLLLLGGEPLQHPEIFHIIENLNETKYPLNYFTNLSIEKNRLLDLINKRKFVKFLTSFHHNKTNLEDFREKIDLILSNNIPIIAKVMWHPSYKKETLEVYNELKKLEKNELFNCSLDLVIIKDTKFTSEDLDWYIKEHDKDRIKDHKVEYINKERKIITENLSFNHIRLLDRKADFIGQSNFFGYKCQAGNRYIIIDENGYVCRCINEWWQNKKLCNILEENIDYNKVLIDERICTSYNCTAEISVPKIRTSKSCASPYNICIILTQKCNWDCDYCDRPNLKERKEPDMNTLKKFFPRLIEKYNDTPVYISGGEPGLINYDILKYVFNFNKKLSVCTNGLFITKGYFKEFYDKIEQVLLQVRLDKGIEVDIDDPKLVYLFVLHHENISKIKDFIEKNGKDKKWIFPFYQPKNMLDESRFQLTKNDYIIALNLVQYSINPIEFKRIIKRIQEYDNYERQEQYRKDCRKYFLFPMFDFSSNKIIFCKQSATFGSFVELNEENFYKLETNTLHFNLEPDSVCSKCFEAPDYF